MQIANKSTTLNEHIHCAYAKILKAFVKLCIEVRVTQSFVYQFGYFIQFFNQLFRDCFFGKVGAGG